ncbi:MAG TPA: SDR family oxidoreductase [Bryobacteraceae bacterium]|nr:SDR family oxidoreductase [Bryobacteraceae bacterium]
MDVLRLFSIAHKTALVTGGSRGIGYMIAEGFVRSGAKVYISARKKEACDQAAQSLAAVGECISIPADVATAEGRERLVSEIKSREPKLDILVNNAGAAWGAPIADFPEAGWDKVVDTNLKAVFFLTRDLLGLLEKAGTHADPARVINIGSIDGLQVPNIETYPYSASKAAVHHMTRVLAVRLGSRHITVNAIAPGPFESKMTEWLLSEHGKQITAQCPLKRIGQPSDMAGAAIFLASPAASYVNGAVIPVDGGIHISTLQNSPI